MYTVNITFKVSHTVYDAWLAWMQETWIPMLFPGDDKADHRLSRLLGHPDEDGVTVVFQMFLPSRGFLNQYLEIRQQKLHKNISDKWGEHVLFFQTVLEEI